MPDNSTGVPTGNEPGVNPTPAAPPPVSPAQNQPATPAQNSQNIVDTSVLIANYEQRIRGFQSENDKLRDALSKSVSNETRLQQAYTELQTRSDSSVNSAAEAAQSAINRAVGIEQQLATALAKAAKLEALLARPHLAPYVALIPETADPEQLKSTLDTLEQIRQRDLEANRPATPTLSTVPVTPPAPNNPYAPWANRPTMNPMLQQTPPVPIPSSSPAQMHPAGPGDMNIAIQQLYDRAKATGRDEDWQVAHAEAKLLAATAIAAQRA